MWNNTLDQLPFPNVNISYVTGRGGKKIVPLLWLSVPLLYVVVKGAEMCGGMVRSR